MLEKPDDQRPPVSDAAAAHWAAKGITGAVRTVQTAFLGAGPPAPGVGRWDVRWLAEGKTGF